MLCVHAYATMQIRLLEVAATNLSRVVIEVSESDRLAPASFLTGYG